MAQMVDADVYAVAASTSEIKLISLTTGATSASGVKGSAVGGSTMLQKSSTLVEHKREVIALAFDSTICASIGMDSRAVITRIIGDSGATRQTKVLLAAAYPELISEQSQVAVSCIEAVGAAQNEQIYMAISDAQGGFTVWHMTLD